MTQRKRLRSIVAFVAGLLSAAALWWWAHPPEARVSVYLVRAQASSSTVQDVSRIVRGRGLEELLAAALRELLAGPTEAERRTGLVTAIPDGTRLRSLRIANGVVLVDLSREIESGGGSSSMLGRLWQIVYTATQLPQASRVQLLVDGHRRSALGGEGVVIDRPLSRPPTPPVF